MRFISSSSLLSAAFAFATVCAVVPSEAVIPVGCLTFPLPSVPIAPVFSIDTPLLSGGNRSHFDVWRQPCQNVPSTQILLIRITPTGSPFLCSGSFNVIQNSIQFDIRLVVNPISGATFCDTLFVATTFAIDTVTSQPFNQAQALTLVHSFVQTTMLEIPAATSSPPPPPPPPPPTDRSLTVVTAGTGLGTIMSAPAGITCPPLQMCSHAFSDGTTVLLAATPLAGSVFRGWTGVVPDCQDGQVTLSANVTCQATFDAAPTASGGGSTAAISVSIGSCNPCARGQRLTVSAFVHNLGATALTVEIKIGIRRPDGTVFDLLPPHDEHILPPGFHTSVTLLDVTIPLSVESGTYVVEGALLEPHLGETLTRTTQALVIQ